MMANFGKAFPALFVGRVYTFDTIARPYPPIFMRLQTDGGSVGTIAAQWRNLNLVSLPGERVSDSVITDKWVWEHPIDPDLRIEYRATYETHAPTLFGPSYPTWEIETLAYDSVGLLASSNWGKPSINNAFPYGDTEPISGTWSYRRNTTLWFTFSGVVAAGLWEDVPDFHPYRH